MSVVQPPVSDFFAGKLAAPELAAVMLAAAAPAAPARAVAPPPAAATKTFDSDDEDMFDDWVPRNKQGNQKSCNVIRGEITRFLATGTMTQTAFLGEIGCNSNSFGRFMKLKGAWNGTQNGVYWGAARLFERQRRRQEWEEKNNPAAAKRKRAEAGTANQKKAKVGDELMNKLAAIEGSYVEGPIYDSCPEVRRKVTAFMKTTGISQAAFLRQCGGVASNSFKNFMSMKAVPRTDHNDWKQCQAGAGNHFYPKAFHFFEKLRVAEGKPKSKARLVNEQRLGPGGCGLRHDDGKRWVFSGGF